MEKMHVTRHPEFDAMEEEYSRLEAAKEAAEKKGCRVIIPEADQLFIDIDCSEDFAVFTRLLPKIGEVIHIKKKEQRESPSSKLGHLHIRITFGREITTLERIALQAILGSDRVRECLSFQRMTRGDAVPTLFFEKIGEGDAAANEWVGM